MRQTAVAVLCLVAVSIASDAAAESQSTMLQICREAVTRKYGSSLAKIDVESQVASPHSYIVDGKATLRDGSTKHFHCDFRLAPVQYNAPSHDV